MSTAFTSDSVLVRNNALPSADLGPDDKVLLDADHGVYFGLEGPAKRIWDLLEQKTTLDAICTALQHEYDVDPQTCERDARTFIGDLIENGLVTIR
jgi:hypothetical protein